ncbi:oligosaccharide flippase family protein [Nocardioides sp. URHA0020]|uniref:oligosaccharide flippase family protein n=1 Tax=Nocardioides sp. URHA0020 TaxID=1380392 RepID=UPI00048EF621|nr:oligosaccharide flippase family protein [Nocardioides sp. URHA0020]
MSAASITSDERVQAPHWTVGDRLAAFAVLLPAEVRGPVVLALCDDLAPHLQSAYPGALVLTDGARTGGWPDPARVVRWDGTRLPIAPGTADLVVVDGRRYDVAAASALVSADGVVALLGDDGPHLLYPSAEAPELVWRRSWPVHMPTGPVPWLRRRLGLSVGRGAAVPRLRVSGDRPTLADAVVADLARATGLDGELVGVITAGHSVLRVRTAESDLAVRLSLTDPDREVDLAARVLRDVPDARAFLPVVVAEGRTAGRPWVATEWTPRRRRPLTWPWPRTSRQWEVAGDLTEVLAGHVTGRTDAGWSARWCDRAHVVPPEVRERWASELEILDGAVPTGWCHGDLWPGNVLLDDDVTTVIDWDNASDDAPLGLDALLLHALRATAGSDDLVSESLLRLVDEPLGLGDTPVGGRPWSAWSRPERRALAVAAVVLHLRNRSLHDLGQELLDRHVAAVADAPTPEPTQPSAEAARTARGALWLATNGIVVKTSQTVVLLTLAALLAPSALGVVALGTLVANVSAVVTSLGTASALVYWRGDVLRAARTAVTVGVAMGAAIAAVLWVAAPSLAAAFHAADGGAAVIRGLTVTLPFLAVAAVTNELLRRRLAFVRRIIPDTTSSVVGAVVAIALVMHGHGVMALVVGQIVQASLTMVLAWVVHPPVLPGWHREDARGLLSYGGPYAGANLLELVQLNIDYLIVSRVLGGEALGQYSLAFRLAFMPYLMVVVVMSGAAFPYLCRQRGAELGRAAVTVMTAALTVVAPICLGIALFADDLVLLGDKWSPGVPVVAWLAAYAGLLSVGQLVQTSLNAAGRPAISMGLRLCHLVLLFGALLLLARHGITAVAVGQVLVATVVALVALTLARLHVTGFSLRRLVLSLRPAAVGVAAMATVVLVVRHLVGLTEPSLAGLLVVGTLGVVAYAATVWVLDRDHLREAGRLVRRTS